MVDTHGGSIDRSMSGQQRGIIIMVVSKYSQVFFYPQALCEVFAKAVREELLINGAL